jgi:tRNA-dihydrouridine synthase
VRRYPDRVVFGSGDIWNAQEIFRMLAYTGVQAVSVARGCIGNPWIFRQAHALLEGRSPEPPTLDEQREVLLEHCELAVLVSGERVGPLRMRKFAIRFAQHHYEPEKVRRAFVTARSLDDWRRALDDHYTSDTPVAVG